MTRIALCISVWALCSFLLGPSKHVAGVKTLIAVSLLSYLIMRPDR